MREGGREKSTATNAGFSLTVYLYVQGWSAIILCMSDINILSEKFICQGISCLSVQGRTPSAPVMQEKREEMFKDKTARLCF